MYDNDGGDGYGANDEHHHHRDDVRVSLRPSLRRRTVRKDPMRMDGGRDLTPEPSRSSRRRRSRRRRRRRRRRKGRGRG